MPSIIRLRPGGLKATYYHHSATLMKVNGQLSLITKDAEIAFKINNTWSYFYIGAGFI
ncbi:MAG TPA: hypothetical protein VFC92_05800 [Bacteroidales bacterium]|nr:hypothetical protein [Bacteroidales bacterium]